MEQAARTSGIVVVHKGRRCFVPAEVAREIVPRPVISRVPGTPLGMALVSGRVVPVIDLGDDRRQLLVCDLDGEFVAIAGLDVVEAGFFEADPDGVRDGAQRIPMLDVAAEIRRAQAELLSGAAP